jgi:hypothetical protein
MQSAHNPWEWGRRKYALPTRKDVEKYPDPPEMRGYARRFSRGVRTAGGSAAVKSRWRSVGHHDDFTDNPVALGVAFRRGNFGAICIFDGGIHRRFPHYDFLAGEALHPMQFGEVTASTLYDQTVLHESAGKLTYYTPGASVPCSSPVRDRRPAARTRERRDDSTSRKSWGS